MQVKSDLKAKAQAWVKTTNRMLRQQHVFCHDVASSLNEREDVIEDLRHEVTSLRHALEDLKHEMRVFSRERNGKRKRVF